MSDIKLNPIKKSNLTRLEKIKIAYRTMKMEHSHDKENARRRKQMERDARAR